MKKRVNKIFKIDLINNTTTCPHISINGNGIADSGIKIKCYCRDTPMDNNHPSTVLYAVQPDGSPIVSTLQADMKVSTLDEEVCRGYKFPIINQNLVSLTVLADNGCIITLI